MNSKKFKKEVLAVLKTGKGEIKEGDRIKVVVKNVELPPLGSIGIVDEVDRYGDLGVTFDEHGLWDLLVSPGDVELLSENSNKKPTKKKEIEEGDKVKVIVRDGELPPKGSKGVVTEVDRYGDLSIEFDKYGLWDLLVPSDSVELI